MLLPDSINTSSKELFNLVAIGRFQRSKDAYITGLEFMGGMRREST
jgi:hypothetical protein